MDLQNFVENDQKSRRKRAWSAPVRLKMFRNQRENAHDVLMFAWKRFKIKERTGAIRSCSRKNVPNSKRERAWSAHARLKMLQNQRENGRNLLMLAYTCIKIKGRTSVICSCSPENAPKSKRESTACKNYHKSIVWRVCMGGFLALPWKKLLQ